MFAVIETATGVAFHLLQAAPVITDAGMVSPVRAPDIRYGTHSVVEVDAPALTFVPGLLALNGTSWEVADQASYDAVMAEQFETRKVTKLAALAARRWQAETGGIFVAGVPIKTDTVSANKLTSAYVQAEKNPAFTVRWKVDTGVFVTLDAATIISLGDAVTAHVQTCFNREDELTTAILSAADTAALEAIDIESGWPG